MICQGHEAAAIVIHLLPALSSKHATMTSWYLSLIVLCSCQLNPGLHLEGETIIGRARAAKSLFLADCDTALDPLQCNNNDWKIMDSPYACSTSVRPDFRPHSVKSWFASFVASAQPHTEALSNSNRSRFPIALSAKWTSSNISMSDQRPISDHCTSD